MSTTTEILPALDVLSWDGKLVGKTTGAYRRCQLEGCGGIRIGVRWPKGKPRLTYPCTKGMAFSNNRWRIL